MKTLKIKISRRQNWINYDSIVIDNKGIAYNKMKILKKKLV